MSELLKDWRKIREFAKEEGVTPACVYAWIRRGLPANDSLGWTMVHVPTAKQWLIDGAKSRNGGAK